ncbi:MAG: universal stress protein A [Myxococcota bacterium]|jgi:universal stress protein A
MKFSPEISYKHILVPVDFSETSRRAFYRAVGYMRMFGSFLTVLHIRENAPAKTVEGVEQTHEALSRLEEGLVRRLDELESDGLVTKEERKRMTLEIGGGKPALEILRYAAGHDIDFIVMGTHGTTGFKHIFMGSVCERVVRRAPCDVLAVKPEGYKSHIDLD